MESRDLSMWDCQVDGRQLGQLHAGQRHRLHLLPVPERLLRTDSCQQCAQFGELKGIWRAGEISVQVDDAECADVGDPPVGVKVFFININ